ncbi:MAG: glycogen synthase [Planctomycetes bacterium]|nr:glycogen synthase [Planctomycetota bacterium]
MRIALITPEFHSLVRRTNLALVAESLAKALQGTRQDVGVFLPRTLDVEEDALTGLTERTEIRIKDGHGFQRFKIREGRFGDVQVFLFENEALFAQRHPYGDHEGPYADNWKRYALFSQAVLASFEALQFMPEVLHCLDWTTGLVPLYHQRLVEAQPEHPLAQAGTYFAIHNLAMQGVFEREILPHIGIPHRYFRNVEGVELGGKVNFLKTGTEFATIVGTHSPSHAQKIQERDRGYGLEETFQRRKKELIGIPNGIDYLAWNPENDPALPAAFGPSDREFAGKKRCKAVLQTQLKLDNGPRTPIACTMGRWDADGGFDLVAEVLTEILERNVELVIMGQGSPDLAQRLRTWEGAFVGRLRVIDGYDQRTAHLMMGGADILFLPSHYQPANPLFAIGMRYGVVPLVYARSGLEDQVANFKVDKRAGVGFHFAPYTAEGLMEGVNECLGVYKDPDKWRLLVRRCLAQNLSWEATAEEYLKAYRRVTRRSKTRGAAE